MNQRFTPQLQRRTIAKVSWRLLPLVVVAYLVAYIDRSNIAVAALTMNKDLGFSPYFYGIGAGIFFIGYLLFEVPSNMVLEKVGARMWIARIMITWGIFARGSRPLRARLRHSPGAPAQGTGQGRDHQYGCGQSLPGTGVHAQSQR